MNSYFNRSSKQQQKHLEFELLINSSLLLRVTTTCVQTQAAVVCWDRYSINPLATSFSAATNTTATAAAVSDNSLLKSNGDGGSPSARFDIIYAQFKLDTCKHMTNSVQLLRVEAHWRTLRGRAGALSRRRSGKKMMIAHRSKINMINKRYNFITIFLFLLLLYYWNLLKQKSSIDRIVSIR